MGNIIHAKVVKSSLRILYLEDERNDVELVYRLNWKRKVLLVI